MIAAGKATFNSIVAVTCEVGLPLIYRAMAAVAPTPTDLPERWHDTWSATEMQRQQARVAELEAEVTLERAWTRVLKLSAGSTRTKLVLRPKQEQLLQLLRDHKSMTPREIWDALSVTKQGAIKLMQPLLDAGLVRRVGTRKSGRYILA